MPLRLKGEKQQQRPCQREEEQEEVAVLKQKEEREVTRERAEKGHRKRKKGKLMKGAKQIPPDEQADAANIGKKEETKMRSKKVRIKNRGIKRGHGQASDASGDSEVCIKA